MAGRSITVRFADQTEPVEVPVRPIGLVAAERKWGGNAFADNPIEATTYAAWTSIGKPGGEFDEWLATIDELIVDDEEDEAAVPPGGVTPTEPSPA